MAGFKVALVNEIEKLYKKKKLTTALIVSIIFIVIGQLAIIGLRSGFGLRGVGSMEFPILVLSVVANTILPLFTALITIDSFSGEFSHNTMKIALTRPVTRLKFFTAKIVAIIFYTMINLFLVLVLSVLAGVMFNANSFTLAGFLKVVVSYIVTLFPMIVLALIIVVLTNLIKSGVGVFFISIFIFMIFKSLELVFSKYSGIFFTSTINWYTLWTMSTFPLLKILRKFMLMLSYSIILFTAGYYLFDKKDF